MDWADKIATNIFNRVEVCDLEKKIAQALREARLEGRREYKEACYKIWFGIYGNPQDGKLVGYLPDPNTLAYPE